MDIAELRRLAEAANPWPQEVSENRIDWDAVKKQTAYLEATRPDVILRLLAVVEAADTVRSQFGNWPLYDAARARLTDGGKVE